MPKYLVHGSYTAEGLRGLLKEGGTSRRKAVENLVKGMGGTVEAFYFAYGDEDVYVIVDVPDEASMAAIALTVNATGSVAVKTSVLITPEAVDEAVKKAVDYRPPGA